MPASTRPPSLPDGKRISDMPVLTTTPDARSGTHCTLLQAVELWDLQAGPAGGRSKHRLTTIALSVLGPAVGRMAGSPGTTLLWPSELVRARGDQARTAASPDGWNERRVGYLQKARDARSAKPRPAKKTKPAAAPVAAPVQPVAARAAAAAPAAFNLAMADGTVLQLVEVARPRESERRGPRSKPTAPAA